MKLDFNVNLAIRFSKLIFLICGLWGPSNETVKRRLYNIYSTFFLMFALGISIIGQVGDLIQVWGNVTMMTGNLFILCTNVAFCYKIINVKWRQDSITTMIDEVDMELFGKGRIVGKDIIRRCETETTRQLKIFILISYTCIFGMFIGTENQQLPLPSWYPFDISKSPGYELAFSHQCIATFITVIMNISLDMLVTALTCQCGCRMRLLSLTLRTLCDDCKITAKGYLTANDEDVVRERVRYCILLHQSVLKQANQLQRYFSVQIFTQFSTSLVIICVSAYQLALMDANIVRILSMAFYLATMMFQVFIYCYHGNRLAIESVNISNAAYESGWHLCGVSVRRSLLLVMTRTTRVAQLKAGGFTELSLATFMAIIKASYSFFTVLKQVEEET